MKLYIIRHGDPDYTIDSLTATGWKEAKLLSRRLETLDVAAFYCSPLGRARDTASLTLEALGAEAEILPWLQEFPIKIQRPHGSVGMLWDWMPEDWTAFEPFYDRKQWTEHPLFREAGAEERYREVCQGLDELLARHGYVRQGNCYRVEQGNEDIIVLFCHFGLECVLLSHLLGISPMVLWHGACAAPSSVTIVNTEERRKGVASFRMSCFGDTSHLYAAGEEPSFHARFCETYENMEQRH